MCGYIYRYRDVIDQVGLPAYLVQTIGYLVSLVIGCVVGYESQGDITTHGFLSGSVCWLFCILLSTAIAKAPTVNLVDKSTTDTTGLTFGGVWANKFYWTTLYMGDQLRKDLNVVIASGNRWEIPFIWPLILFASPLSL
jgi:solute carrier family 6 GABA transporter-like protein 1